MNIPVKLLNEAEQFTKDLLAQNSDRFAVVSKADAFRKYVQPGSLISYKYDALHKSTLQFWDSNPAIIVLAVRGYRMLGLNLHFVPFPMRKLIVEYVLKKNSTNIKLNKPISIDYRTMKSFLYAIKATICIRAYLIRRITSRVTIVKSHRDYIIGATSLKTSKIYKMSSDQIYQIALGRSFSTKKKVGQRKTDRAQKKKALKIK